MTDPARPNIPSATRVKGLSHVSIFADDLEASERFYSEIFGLERIPSPNFGFPVRWLRLGDLQLHLQTFDVGRPRDRTYQHFGIEVADFLGAYRALRARGAFEPETRYASLWLLPCGELQMFARDPSDNLIEVDLRDASTIDLMVFDGQLRVLADEEEQSDTNVAARLFLTGKIG